jgi:hypothetical protein
MRRLERRALKSIVLVLDVMGVLYESADDVAKLLVPFVRENGARPIAKQSRANTSRPASAESVRLHSEKTSMCRLLSKTNILPVIGWPMICPYSWKVCLKVSPRSGAYQTMCRNDRAGFALNTDLQIDFRDS